MGRQVKRARVPLAVKLAAALLTMERYRLAILRAPSEEAEELYQDAKQMTAAQIISLFQFDHYPIRHADGGPDEAWNLTPLFIGAHRVKSARVDQPGMAKERRIEAKWAAHNRAVAAGRKPPPRTTSRWPRRPMRAKNP